MQPSIYSGTSLYVFSIYTKNLFKVFICRFYIFAHLTTTKVHDIWAVRHQSMGLTVFHSKHIFHV